MLGSVHSPDPSDDYLRRLLDQRTARADPHGLYSALSEFSDTPSIYSHGFFSPRPSDGPHLDLPPTGYPYKSPTLPSNRRLLDDPSTSMLDLDEDVRSSMAISETYDRDDKDDNKVLEAEGDEEDEDTLPHTSYLGPKMRFHSRAPWEMEDESLQEGGETEASQGNFVSILTGGLGKASLKSRSSSPRPSNFARPSGESSRSQMNFKRSFETTSSHISHPRGALYALAQESLSTTSLGRPPRPGRQDGLRGKFSLGRLRSHSPTPPSPNPSVTRLPLNRPSSNTPPSPRASYDTTSSALDVQAFPGLSPRFAERRRSLPHPDEGVHPYANPDLVISYATERPPQSPLRSALQYPGVPRNDSIITVTENTLPTKSTLAPDTPAAPAKRRMSHIQSRDISPHSIHSTLLQSDSPSPQSGTFQESAPPIPTGANNILGWTDRAINPGFSLISLEEARAQRSRTATAQPLPSLDSASSGETSITTTFHNATQETSTTLASAFSDSNHFDKDNLRSRARSISTSAKAKNPFQSFVGQPKPERRDSEPTLSFGQLPGKDVAAPAGKTLKHKKSGFMRLFGNSGKLNEKDERAVPIPPPPPPVPTIPDAHALPRNNKLSPNRIPVPSLSPSLLEAAALQEGGDSSAESLQAAAKALPSPKRTPPLMLSINTGSSPTSTDPSSSSKGSFPQSAPPHIPDFPTLKLRPISTLFSAQFGDHIVTSELNNGEGDTKDKGRERNIGQVRPQRQNSLASSSDPSSASATSFAESQFGLSPIASSSASAATALTTPTTGGLMSPVTPSSWSYGTRFSVEQQSALSHVNASTTPTSTPYTALTKDPEAAGIIKSLQEQLDNSRRMWERRVWDLESHVRDLTGEIAELKARCAIECEGQYCEACGKERQSGASASRSKDGQQHNNGMMNRPRARTGGLSRFVNTQL